MKVRSSREIKREIKRISESLSKHRRESESSILVVVGEGSKMI
jgi:phenylpyruvate tautomerase PptA (4-oxalocrotonate tautomerase family)